MAINLDHELLPGIVVAGTYWIPGVIELRVFDETARIEWWGYFNEDARHQRLEIIKREDLLRPMTVKVLQIPKAIYDLYFAPAVHSGDGQNMIEAIYREAKEVAEPFGLKAFFESGQDS